MLLHPLHRIPQQVKLHANPVNLVCFGSDGFDLVNENFKVSRVGMASFGSGRSRSKLGMDLLERLPDRMHVGLQ